MSGCTDCSYSLHKLWTLHRLWTLHSSAAFYRKGTVGGYMAHMHPLPLCVQILLSYWAASILSRLHTMKAPIFFRTASHEKLTLFIINMHFFNRPLSCPLRHTHIRMHALTHASTYTWCLLRLSPTTPCSRLVIIYISSLVAVTLYYLCRRKLEHDYSKLAGKMDTDKAHLVEETQKLEWVMYIQYSVNYQQIIMFTHAFGWK